MSAATRHTRQNPEELVQPWNNFEKDRFEDKLIGKPGHRSASVPVPVYAGRPLPSSSTSSACQRIAVASLVTCIGHAVQKQQRAVIKIWEQYRLSKYGIAGPNQTPQYFNWQFADPSGRVASPHPHISRMDCLQQLNYDPVRQHSTSVPACRRPPCIPTTNIRSQYSQPALVQSLQPEQRLYNTASLPTAVCVPVPDVCNMDARMSAVQSRAMPVAQVVGVRGPMGEECNIRRMHHLPIVITPDDTHFSKVGSRSPFMPK